MINLLPPEEKRQILAGRSNTLLWRYCVVSLVLGALLLAMIVAMYILLINAKSRAEQKIDESVSQTAEYAKVERQANEFKQNLTMARAILDKEGNYSGLAVAIAQVLPHGVVLQSLQLDGTTITKPMKLTALAKNEQDGLRLKSSFEQSPLFRDVHLDSITRAVDSQQKTTYPVTITINVTLVPEGLKK